MIEATAEVRNPAAHYSIYVGNGILGHLGDIVASVTRSKQLFIISSPKVFALHGEALLASFARPPEVLLVADGEEEKTFANAGELLSALIDRGARRDALLIIFGGGVIGDAAGFAASVFLRGVDVIHVPTTLLAQVDSSIGGKVAVNHIRGKNLIGSFHPPRAVLSDVRILQTLPPRELLSGFFESLKSGVIGDVRLFELTEQTDLQTIGADIGSLQEIVERSVRVKARIVEADEREGDVRRLLNYGHTVGHALEAVTQYKRFTHGEAVGLGMIAANRLAVARGLLDGAVARRIDLAVLRHPLPLTADLDRDALLEAAGRDKKFTSKKRVMVLPVAIGECVVVEDVRSNELELCIDALLETRS